MVYTIRFVIAAIVLSIGSLGSLQCMEPAEPILDKDLCVALYRQLERLVNQLEKLVNQDKKDAQAILNCYMQLEWTVESLETTSSFQQRAEKILVNALDTIKPLIQHLESKKDYDALVTLSCIFVGTQYQDQVQQAIGRLQAQRPAARDVEFIPAKDFVDRSEAISSPPPSSPAPQVVPFAVPAAPAAQPKQVLAPQSPARKPAAITPTQNFSIANFMYEHRYTLGGMAAGFLFAIVLTKK